MPINFDSTPITDVHVGSVPVNFVYSGSKLAWQRNTWKFEDNFDSLTVGKQNISDMPSYRTNVADGNVYIGARNGRIYNTYTNSSGLLEVLQSPDTENITLQATFYNATAGANKSDKALVFCFGNVYSNNCIKVQIYQDRVDFKSVNTVVSSATFTPWVDGDIFRVERAGATITVFKNNSQVGQGTVNGFTGAAHRKAGFSLWREGLEIDDFKMRW